MSHTAKELKEILIASGVDPSSCLEKSELEAFVKRLEESGGDPVRAGLPLLHSRHQQQQEQQQQQQEQHHQAHASSQYDHEFDKICFYELLGVEKDATPAQIKKAYYKLARECHPDKAGQDPRSEARFKAITMANEVLSDPEKRKLYDLHGRDAVGGAGAFSSLNLEQMMRAIFGGGSFDHIFGDVCSLPATKSLLEKLGGKKEGEEQDQEKKEENGTAASSSSANGAAATSGGDGDNGKPSTTSSSSTGDANSSSSSSSLEKKDPSQLRREELIREYEKRKEEAKRIEREEEQVCELLAAELLSRISGFPAKEWREKVTAEATELAESPGGPELLERVGYVYIQEGRQFNGGILGFFSEVQEKAHSVVETVSVIASIVGVAKKATDLEKKRTQGGEGGGAAGGGAMPKPGGAADENTRVMEAQLMEEGLSAMWKFGLLTLETRVRRVCEIAMESCKKDKTVDKMSDALKELGEVYEKAAEDSAKKKPFDIRDHVTQQVAKAADEKPAERTF